MNICNCFLKSIFAIFILFPIITVNGQAAFQKYGGAGHVGDLPKPTEFFNSASLDNVDHQSGTLNVSIPLYTIQSGKLELPISLQYQASGIKADYDPSVVGIGWVLNAGGKILTNVIGKADNGPTGIDAMINPWSALPYTTTSIPLEGNLTNRQYVIDLIAGKRDNARDVYNYQLPNLSGSFVRNGDQFLTFPYEPTVYVSQNEIKHDGINYQFETGDVRGSLQRTFYTEAFYPDTSAFTLDWKPISEATISTDYNLKYITSELSDDTITFKYISLLESVQSHRPFLFLQSKVVTSASMPISRSVEFNSLTNTWQENNNYQIKPPFFTQNKMFYQKLTRLSEILFTDGRLVFIYSPSYDFLTEIRIEKKVSPNNYSLYQKISLIPVEWNTNVKFLQNLVYEDVGGHEISRWAFSYNSPNLVAHLNASTGGYRESTGVDRWGFFNGKINNKVMIENPYMNISLNNKKHDVIINNDQYPTDYNSLYILNNSREGRYLYPYTGTTNRNRVPFADREFNFTEAVKNTLVQIVTPFNSVVDYKYEPHEYLHFVPSGNSSFTSSVRKGGGIRIKEIKISELKNFGGSADVVLSKKEFKYGSAGTYINNEDGVGDVSYPANILHNASAYPGSPGGSTQNIAFKSNNFVLLSHSVKDLTLKNGSYAVYRSVSEIEYKSDSTYLSAKKLGSKTTYLYNSPSQDYWRQSIANTNQLFFPTGLKSPGVTIHKFYENPKSILKYTATESH